MTVSPTASRAGRQRGRVDGEGGRGVGLGRDRVARRRQRDAVYRHRGELQLLACAVAEAVILLMHPPLP